MKLIKYTLIISLLFSSVTAFGQKTKRVTNKTAGYKEIYFVLKSDNSIRHGVYEKYSRTGKMLQSGYYKMGLKDSVWKEYSKYGDRKFSQGYYKEDKPWDIWEYFDNKGMLEQRYNHTTDELIYSRPEETLLKISPSGDTIVYDRPAQLIGGSSVLSRALREIVYPPIAKEKNIQGRVLIKIYIDSTGNMTGYSVLESADPNLDAEALRIVGLLPKKWIPGVVNGKKVNVAFTLPITFKME